MRRLVLLFVVSALAIGCGHRFTDDDLTPHDIECMDKGIGTPGGHPGDGEITLYPSTGGAPIDVPRECVDTWGKIGPYAPNKR